MIILISRLLKKILKACPVNAGLNMAFKDHTLFASSSFFWLQTLVAINSDSCHRLFSSLCTQLSEVAVLFDQNLSRLPFLRQVVNSDLLIIV